MKFDHTPGPWKYDHIKNAYEKITGCYLDIEMQANARLIAHAPEMLEELRKCFKDGMEGYQMREGQAIRIKNLLESATGKTIFEILKIDEVE